MITPNEFIRIWNQLLSKLKKVVTEEEQSPSVLFFLDYSSDSLSDINFVINRVNNDEEFQNALVRRVRLHTATMEDNILVEWETINDKKYEKD
jgi:hypothetical protein